MSTTASESPRLHLARDLDATMRLEADQRTARDIAQTWGMPVVLFHNTAPGTLAACHRRSFSHGDPRNLISLVGGRLIVQFETMETARDTMAGFIATAGRDSDTDLAGSVLAHGFDGTGARIAA